MCNKNVLSIHTVILLLAAGLSLAACNDSAQKQASTSDSTMQKVGVQENHKTVQTSIPENAQPIWKEIPHTKADEEIFESVGKATQFFLNTNSVENNPGNANWRNTIAAVNIIPTTGEAQSVKPLSLMVRYTVDCTNNLVLPLDIYLFDQKQTQGKLLSEQGLAIGPVKLEGQEGSFYSEMKNEVCALAASSPLDLLTTTEPQWLLIHEPQPPRANPFFAYIDKKSVRPSIEYAPWKRATMLIQPSKISNIAILDEQSPEPASQLWQLSVDCTRQQFRFDFLASMAQLDGQGKIMQIGLSDTGFETPKEKSEKKLIELICSTDL